MVAWGIFRHKRLPQQKVTTGRFEIERNGEVAYLEYSLSGNVLGLIHTEVPDKLRGMGLPEPYLRRPILSRRSVSAITRYSLFVRNAENPLVRLAVLPVIPHDST
jgi:hypothetical protein